jgi:hypothetical protein
MTTLPRLSEEAVYKHIGGERTVKYVNENVEGVAFVSGMQGLIAITFMEEEPTETVGENKLTPCFLSVEVATPTDSYMPKVTTLH